MDEVESRTGATHLAADDQARPAGDRRPGVGELAVVHPLGEVVGQFRQLADEVRSRDDRFAAADVGDGVHAALEECLAQAAVHDVLGRRVGGQAAVRDRHRQVEARLGGGIAEDLVVQAGLDEDVGAGPEQDGGQRHHRDEREREPGPDPAAPQHEVSGPPCSPRRGR